MQEYIERNLKRQKELEDYLWLIEDFRDECKYMYIQCLQKELTNRLPLHFVLCGLLF